MNNNNKQKEFVLCYIERPWAYFTTKDLSKQWGDDWDDAPYEWNAEEPYGPHERIDGDFDDNGNPLWLIERIAFDDFGELETPAEKCGPNSPYSVRDINSGACSWLASKSWSTEKKVAIPAGTSLWDFIKMIQSIGGKVYLEQNEKQ